MRLALAAETLAGRQVWRRPRLNDIAMHHIHKDGMDSLSVNDFMKVLCILAKDSRMVVFGRITT